MWIYLISLKRAVEMLLDGRNDRRSHGARVGLGQGVVAADCLDAAVARFIDIILARSAAIRLGKPAFYQQIEQPVDRAYITTSETMSVNRIRITPPADTSVDTFIGSAR
jgi:enoyl-CoA hydratase/carnithine racemase